MKNLRFYLDEDEFEAVWWNGALGNFALARGDPGEAAGYYEAAYRTAMRIGWEAEAGWRLELLRQCEQAQRSASLRRSRSRKSSGENDSACKQSAKRRPRSTKRK